MKILKILNFAIMFSLFVALSAAEGEVDKESELKTTTSKAADGNVNDNEEYGLENKKLTEENKNLTEENQDLTENKIYKSSVSETNKNNTNLQLLEDEIFNKTLTDIKSQMNNTKPSGEATNKTGVWEKISLDELFKEDEIYNKLMKDAEKIKSRPYQGNSEEEEGRREWEKKISDFEAAEMLTFELPQGSKELVFDPINEVPSHVKLAFVLNDETSKINFHIVNPNQETFYTVNNQALLYYEFNATIPGVYVFTFDNINNANGNKITFAIHQGNSSDTHLSHKQIDQIYSKLGEINREIKTSLFTARLLSKKYDSHFETSKKHNRSIVFFSIIETAIMSFIFFLQLFYIKRLAKKINL